MSIYAACHCGAVRLTLVAAPETVTDCNCSICRRYGVLWAYYPRGDVSVGDGATDRYAWNKQALDFHRCAMCGCVTHWASRDPGRDRIGINARLLEPAVLARARVRRLDGAVTGLYLDD